MEIKLVKSGKDLKDFIKLPWKIYKNDRFWVPPLISEVKFVLNQHKNPFWKHAQGEYFIAKKEGKVVGRIAALIDHLHVNHRKEKCGFFGFFESTNDYDVAELLLSTAKMYLKENGMEIMRGPMNPSINEECGTLIDGFDYPPFLLMTHNPPYYKELLERFGLLKAVDWYAYLGPIPSQLPKEIEIASQFAKSKNSNFVVRPIDLQNLAVEAEKVREIFNSAWSKNWGFVPFTAEEIFSMGKRLKSMAVPELALIAEVDSMPAGVLLGIPNFNQVLKHLNGHLSPVGFLKALYYSRKIDSGRLVIMGVKEEYRKMGLEAVMYARAMKAAYKTGLRWVESSMILEQNNLTRRAAELTGGKIYKTYRIYEMPIV
jgi:hypothetical protein